MNKELTIVTGIWDLRRDAAGDGFKRPFSHYTEHFIKLLKTDANMVIFVDPEHEDLVWEHRSKENTAIYFRGVDHFKQGFEFYDRVQELRTDPEWFGQG